MNFDICEYLRSSRLKNKWKLVLAFGVLYIAYYLFRSLINQYFVNGILSSFPHDKVIKCTCIILLIYLIYKLIKYFINGLFPTIESLIYVLSFGLLFYLCIWSNSDYEFYSFMIFSIHIRYATLLVIGIGYCILDFRRFSNPPKGNSTLSIIEDESTPETEDLIGSEGSVARIAEIIQSTVPKHAISIGIFAAWGSGKTDFLRRLMYTLNKNNNNGKHHKDSIILEFNPWRPRNSETIIEDFFNTLSDGLKAYNKRATAVIRDYTLKILGAGKDLPSRISFAFFNEIMKDPSILHSYDNINSIIKATGKKIIISIDDIDRMSGTEIIQLLGLMRNTANFYNTFFIIALDHDYCITTIRNTKLFSKEEQYLKKIFQLVITLPKIRKETFGDEIRKFLKVEAQSENEELKINSAISFLCYNSVPDDYGLALNNFGAIENMMDNYRDVKRFCNTFKISYRSLKDDVNIIDLFLLELIKLKSFYVYERLSDRSLLEVTGNDDVKFKLNSTTWEQCKEHLQAEGTNENEMEKVLHLLFIDKRENKLRAFSNPTNFYLYFCFQLFDQIPLKEFNETIQKDWNDVRDQFLQWIGEGKRNDINNILDYYLVYENRSQFEKFLKVFLSDPNNLAFTSRAARLILLQNGVRYFDDKKSYELFIISILEDKELDLYARALLANEIIIYNLKNGDKAYCSIDELKEIILNLFDEYLSTRDEYDQGVYRFYLLNSIENGNENSVQISEKAHRSLREFLNNPAHFRGFMKFLIRSYSIPNDGNFCFEPYTENIFGPWKYFRKAVEAYHKDNDDKTGSIQVILNAISEYEAGKNKFTVNDRERKEILKRLKENNQYPLNL